MSQEPKRGCGYRKVGGTYLVGGGIGRPCDRLPFELSVCPVCSQGVHPARGWTWIDVAKFFQGPHLIKNQPLYVAPGRVYEESKLCPCTQQLNCPLCGHPETMGKAGLLWIGAKFYKTPQDFIKEGIELGFSRRIKAVPQGFKIGETWVLLAHKNAIEVPRAGFVSELVPPKDKEFKPGIFYCWLPTKIERICLESQRGSEEVAALKKRGISPVFVPDDDPDHRGSVHDKSTEEEA